MDSLHAMLRSIRPETKARGDHLSVYREILAHLGELQRKAERSPRLRTPTRRKAGRRAT